MGPESEKPLVLHFGPFDFDSKTRLLTAAGQPIPLKPKPAHLLHLFLENRGVVLSREQIRDLVWETQHLENGALERQVSDLRTALRSGSDIRWIETLTKRGYRFIGEDEECKGRTTLMEAPGNPPNSEEEKNAAAPLPTAPSHTPLSTHDRSWLAIAAPALLALVTALLAVFSSTKGLTPFYGARPTLAVITFRVQTERPRDFWLASAAPALIRARLFDARITMLSDEETARAQLDLKLPAADRLASETLARLHRLAGVDVVILGSVAVLSPDPDPPLRIRLHIQNANTGETVETITVAGSNLESTIDKANLELRNALRIPKKAESALSPDQVETDLTPAARPSYFAGLEKLHLLDAKSALVLLQQAAGQDPKSAQIQAALGEAWSILGYSGEARAAYRRAFDLSLRLLHPLRLEIEARYHAIEGDWTRVVEIQRSLWTVFPEQPEHGLRLAEAQTAAGKPADALATVNEIRHAGARRIDPRLDITEAIAYEFSGQFAKEVEVATRAAEHGRLTGSKSLEARALLRKCWSSYSLGDYDTAAAAARSAHEIYLAAGDIGGAAMALKNLADVLDDHNQHDEAVKIYSSALKEFRRVGYERAIAVTLMNMAEALRSLGELEPAGKAFNEALRISSDIKDEALRAVALNGSGTVDWRRGELALAKRSYEEAIKIQRRRQDVDRAAIALGNLALVEQDLGDLASAQRDLMASLADLRKTGDEPGVARTLGNLGDLATRQGQLKAAREFYSEHLAIGVKLGEERQRAYALMGMGQVLFLEGDLEGASSKQQEAMTIRARIGEKGLVAETQLSLARTRLAQERWQEAARHSNAAWAEFRNEKEADLAESAWAALARAKAGSGDIVDALRMAHRCEPARIKDVSLLLTASIDIARALQNSGEGLSTKIILQRAHDLAKSKGYTPEELETRLLLIPLEPRGAGKNSRLEIIAEALKCGLGLIASQAKRTSDLHFR